MKNRAFTLVEVLLVVSIISMLSSIAVVSFGTARVRASDSARLEETKQMSLAMQAYRSDYGTYPAMPDPAGQAVNSNETTPSDHRWSDLWGGGLSSYLSPAPSSKDPATPYAYVLYEDPETTEQLAILFTYQQNALENDPNRCYPFGAPSHQAIANPASGSLLNTFKKSVSSIFATPVFAQTSESWTFDGPIGVADVTSGFFPGWPGDQRQTLFMQGGSSVSQTSSWPSGGSYTVTANASLREGYSGGNLSVYVDSTYIGSVSPQTTQPNADYDFGPFFMNAGDHTLTFSFSGDWLFLDNIRISGPGHVPLNDYSFESYEPEVDNNGEGYEYLAPDGSTAGDQPYIAPNAAPVAIIDASPRTVESGNKTYLSWNSNNTVSCSSPDFPTGGATSGTWQTPALTGSSAVYHISCVNSYGDQVDANVGITIKPPVNDAGCHSGEINIGGTCYIVVNQSNQTPNEGADNLPCTGKEYCICLH